MANYKKLKKELLSNQNKINQNTNNAVVHININDTSDIISPYAEDNKAVINSEFASFLENAVKDEPLKSDLTLKITAKDCNLNTVSGAIKNYYYKEFIDTQHKLKHNITASIITLIIGLIALTATIILNNLSIPIIIGGTIDIFAWVFVWESVDLFFFRRSELKRIEYRQINFINATIIYK